MSPEDKEVPFGETGELWSKDSNVFQGYLNNLQATADALTEDDYFQTGDVGYQDIGGNPFITARVKESIKYKDFQAPQAELKVYDKDKATMIPRAYGVPATGMEGGEECELDTVKWSHVKVANHKRLQGDLRFRDGVPKSVSGKILRRLLNIRALGEEKKGQRVKL